MSKLINLLLNNKSPKFTKNIDKEAIACYQLAFNKAKENAKGAKFGADQTAVALETTLTPMLMNENLVNRKRYQLISEAIKRWEFKDPSEYGNDEEAHTQLKLVRVKATLLEFLLPVLRCQQQIKALKAECQKYLNHLKLVIRKEESKAKPDQELIGLLRKKKDAVLEMQDVFKDNRNTSSNEQKQLKAFTKLFNRNKTLFTTRPDNVENVIFKAILTFITVGIACFFGLWRPEGEKADKKINSILGPTEESPLDPSGSSGPVPRK